MQLKVFLKLKKTLKPSLLGKKTPKNPKNPRKPTGLVFFKKTRVFSNPAWRRRRMRRRSSSICLKAAASVGSPPAAAFAFVEVSVSEPVDVSLPKSFFSFNFFCFFPPVVASSFLATADELESTLLLLLFCFLAGALGGAADVTVAAFSSSVVFVSVASVSESAAATRAVVFSRAASCFTGVWWSEAPGTLSHFVA